ncbi:MAG TPA: PaaI family thioesterase [Acidimicrobiales bacterium]|nr:PaaI family thioesterase [Acidimicrobiales bacterium]
MPRLTATELGDILAAAFPDSEVPLVESVDDHEVLCSLIVTSRHGRPGGTLSGPVMMMLADTTAWMAVLAEVGAMLLAVTTSLHIDFLRKPDLENDLMSRGRLLKLGRKLAVVDVELFSRGHHHLVAKAQVTYSLPSSGHDSASDR